MKTMHLFAGGGGGMYADLILGHTPTVAVEWEKAACDVLRARKQEWWPKCEIIGGDIRAFSGVRYAGEVDCIHAGFPCQDLSVAGKRAGLDGDRSSLYVEALRIYSEVRPRYLFLENVTGIFTANDGEALNRVASDLASLGLDARWLPIRAADVGANHRRDRWWCLAMAHPELAGARSESGEVEADRGWGAWGDESPLRQAHRAHGADRAIPTGEVKGDVSHAGRERVQQRGELHGVAKCGELTSGILRNGASGGHIEEEEDRETKGVANANGQRGSGRWREQPTQESGEGGQECYWSTEPDVGRVANGVAQRGHRLKMLGNGQVPLQAAYAWVMLGGPTEVR